MLAKYKYHFWLHFTILIWGFTGVLGKYLSDFLMVQPASIVFYRMFIGVLTLGMYYAISGKSLYLPKKTTLSTLGIGFLISAHWITFFMAIQLANVSLALICLSTTSLFTSIFEPLLLGKKYDFKESLMGLAVIVGIAIIANDSTQHAWAIFLAITSAFLAALFSVLNAGLVKNHSAGKISFYELLGGLVVTSIFLALKGDLSVAGLSVSVEAFGLLLILGAICTAFAFLMGVEVAKHIPVFTVNVSINLEPIYAMLLALYFFGDNEVMTFNFYLGSTIIIGVILLNAFLKRNFSKNKVRTSS